MAENGVDTDVIGAKRLGTRTIYLEREVTEHRPVDPDVTIKSLSEIRKVIDGWREFQSDH